MNHILIVTIFSVILFMILAFTPLFKYVDNLITNLTGYEPKENIYVVLLVHVLIFAIIIYGILSLFSNGPEDKREPEDKLEAFDVGGSLSCK